MSALTDFIDRIIQRFPPSFRWDDAQKNSWTEDMVRELGGFDADVLNRAAHKIIQTRGLTTEERKTPTVAECIRYCKDARGAIFAESNAGTMAFATKTPEPYLMDWREDDFANDIALNRKNPLCIQAAKEGWIGTLHTFVRKHRRMPSATDKIAYRKSSKVPEQMVAELEWCKREAKDFDEAYALAVRGNGSSDLRALGAMRDLVSNVGDAMLKRRNELADIVLKGATWR
jgi:hypothetical protein